MREEVVSQQMGDVAVLTLHGPCYSQTVVALEARCREAILQKAKHILIDCKNLTSLSSSAMRCLLSKTSEAEKAGICLVIYNLSTDHAKLLRNAGLLSVLHVKDNFIDAYQHCKSSAALLKGTRQ